MNMTDTAKRQLGTSEHLYLELLKKVLTRIQFPEKYRPINPRKNTLARFIYSFVQPLLAARKLVLVREVDFNEETRQTGDDRPSEAETMVGMLRLDNLQECIMQIAAEDIPGDLIETGIWRGGVCIFMRAVLRSVGDTERIVWACDSFEGLPKPNVQAYPEDTGDVHWTYARLAVSIEEVKRNFAKYGMLDDQVRFLKGLFSETLPAAPIESLSLIRLDGDMYESTMDGLKNLYPKLSPGGFVIVDDYLRLEGCRAAVDDYRREHNINEEIKPIDNSGAFWRREPTNVRGI